MKNLFLYFFLNFDLITETLPAALTLTLVYYRITTIQSFIQTYLWILKRLNQISSTKHHQ